MTRAERVLKTFWKEDGLINQRLADCIERNRKSMGRLYVVNKAGDVVPDARVRIRLKDHDFKLGANLFMLDEHETEEKNAIYRKLFPEVFNLATIPFYWSDLEPEDGKPRFAKDSPKIYRRPAPDLCLEYCNEHGIMPKGHCLYYDKFTPYWAPGDVEGQKRRLDKRMRECGERYADTIPMWEVVNELYGYGNWGTAIFNKGRRTTSLFYEPDVIDWCFNTARRYFPTNKLVINDAQYAWTRLHLYERGAYYQAIKMALEHGAPIDSVGMQFHMMAQTVDKEEELADEFLWPSRLYSVMDDYQSLGIPMQVTEVTVSGMSDSKEDEEIQAEILKYLMKIWFSHPIMDTVVYWNVADGYAAWAEPGDMTKGENRFRGGLCRFDLTPKPAFNMLKELFHETWHTEESGITNDNGVFEWRGFMGKYDCEVTVNGKTVTAPLHLTKKSDNEFWVRVDV